MASQLQKDQLYKRLKDYKNRFLQKRYSELDESATRLMINSLLTEVLGYKELEDIKTEYRIRGEYADYVIQISRKKHFVVEVKAVQLDLSDKHLRQCTNYAANEGIDWIILTNGKEIQLYKVLFKKPINVKKVFSYNLADPKELKMAVDFMVFLTKKSVLKNELNDFWLRFEALEPNNLCKNLYALDVVRFLRRTLKTKTGLLFNEDDILESIHQVVIRKLDSVKPRAPLQFTKRKLTLDMKDAVKSTEVMEDKLPLV